MIELFIDGEAADIAPETVIAFTFRGWNPIFPSQVGVTYSNQFSLPPTVNNLVLIGLSGNLESQSQVLKELIPIRYVQNGVEIIPNGSLKVIEITQDAIECVIFSDLDFYSIIKNKSLVDLDYTDINPSLGTSDYSFAYTIRNNAEIAGGAGEYFSAILNLGLNIVNNAGTIEYINYNSIQSPFTDVGFTPVFFGYKQVLQRIFDDAGYAYDWGKLFDGSNDNPKFNSLAIMQNGYSDEYRFQYSESFRDEYEFTALVDADETFTNIGAAGTRRFLFKNEVKTSVYYEADPTGSPRSRYTVDNADTANSYFSGMIRFRGVVNRTGNAATVAIFLNGSALTGTAAAVLSVGDNTVDISSPYTGTLLKDGDIIEVGYTQVGADPTSVTYYAGGEFSLEVLGGPYPSGTTYLYLNQILPDVSQLSVFKDFLFRFGQIPKFSGQSVSFKSLKDILDDPTSLNDWTEKRQKKSYSHEVHLDLAQRNYYRYESSDDFTSDGFRQGYFDIDDTTLPKEEFYTSIWSSTFDALTEGIKTGQLSVQEVPSASTLASFSDNTGFRLLLTRQKYDTEPDVVWGEFPDDTPQTDYTVACFSKVDTISYERSLGYDQVLKEWYTSDGTLTTGFLERLKDAKLVTRYYYLTEADIYTLDPHKMIYDNGVYFMFPVIKSFVPGKVTEVEMLKI